MRKLFVTALIVLSAALYLVQTAPPPPTVGPAAEAITDEIEITMDQTEPVAATASNLK